MPDGTTMRWGVAGAALAVALFAWALCGWLRGRGVRPLRGIGGFLPDSAFGTLLFAFAAFGMVRSAATKATNGTDSASGGAPALRDAPDPADGAHSALRFTSVAVGSNSVSLALAWTTNFTPARAWLELHWSPHSLTNGWSPLATHEIAAGETNAAFEVAVTNGSPSAAFFRAFADTLELDLGGCDTYVREDGTRLHVATHTGQFPVSVLRPERPAGLSAPDPAFAADPFAHAGDVSYDPVGGTLSVASNGIYRLPDGSDLFVASVPTVTFGSPHAYTGPDYPIDSPSLREGWTKGGSPLTGCSCVPEVDFGGGLVVGDRAPVSRSGDGLPAGMHLEWEYEPGGVWVTCFAGTNVVWRTWESHRHEPCWGGREDGLDGPEGKCCGCGDDAPEGPSVGSVRFRIPLGSPYAGMTSGFLYFNESAEFDPTPSSFRLMARGDALVSDTTEGGVRTVACSDYRGRTLVVSPAGGGAVEVEVRDTASGSLLHTWTVGRAPGGGMAFEKTSILGNAMERKTISCGSGGWTERDEIGDVSETRSVSHDNGATSEERIVECAGAVVSHVVTVSECVGMGANAVVRQTGRRELGADGAWKTSHATYWCDPAHPLRHGCARLVRGDDREWTYTAFDDCGRETFRLEQRNGSAAPADSESWSLSNLPQGVDAFATVRGYEPLAGDSAHTNDFARARTESRYAVSGGAAALVSRTWRRYVHSATNGLPVVTVTTVRACSQSAGMDDPGNAVSSETAYDEESGLVPYVLRGRTVASVGEDGVETRFEAEVAGGSVRTVERRFAGGVEAPTRRVTEVDLHHGNLLYEATALAADGTEFGWREHVYDDRNRLRSTVYDDGSSETNAYSCCRLLWSSDRHGARRVRNAQTGTDHLEHAFVDESVRDLPKDPEYRYGPWGDSTFRQYSPATIHRFDGTGRETNTIVRTARIEGGVLTVSANPARAGLVAESATSYPQGVSDVSETVGFRGLLTRRMQFASQSCETTAEGEFAPGEASPSSVATNVSIRGGGTVEWRGRSGKWSCRRSFSEYGADGCRTDYDVSESSDGGTVTNSATSYDFLGRVARRATPLSQVVYEYGGPSPRVLSTLDEASGVAVTNLYDEAGEPVGAVSGGVEEMRRTGYEFISNAWWRVERSAQIAGGVTNSPSATYTRLTGLSDALRSEVVECRDGAEVRRTVVAYDPVEGTERETVFDAASGESWTVGMFGYPVEAGTPTHVVTNFYGPVGKVFVRQLSVPGETSRRVEEIEVDALGDETCRVVCDRYWLDEAPYSEFVYDCRGNRCIATNAVGAATFAAHDPDGNVVAEGGATYPTEADYDASGRRVALRTTRDGEAWDETSWAYDAATGVCTNKTYADGSTVSYTHTTDGLPLRTTYASGRWKENAYDSRRQLAQVSHSDSSLDYSIARDAFGRATNVTDAAGNEWRYEYDAFGDVLREEAITAGRDDPIAPNIAAAVTRAFDSVGRPTGFALSVGGTPKGGVGYEYGDGGLLAAVFATNAQGRTFSVAYSNHAGRCVGYAITMPGGDTIRRVVTRDFYRRDLVNGISTTFNDSALDSLVYTYDALSRPTTRTTANVTNSVASAFAYNDRSEVASVQIGTNQFAHAYDFIGNQTNFAANAATNVYTHNGLNQLVGRDAPIAPQTSFVHDPDGNMTSDGTFAYSYDAENRLASVSSNGITLVVNQYDYRGRRIRKTTPTTETTFVYDGWNLIHETTSAISGATTNVTEIQYFWGADLSETLQGAGGVGGLLAVSIAGGFYFPACDNNGNVTKYIDEQGNIVAEYTYDAFGKAISQSGTMADFFRIRFSSKYFDAETGFCYYGYRFYSPTLMRWLNRDPIEEDGGLNLYGFCVNNAVCAHDSLGQKCIPGTFNIIDIRITSTPQWIQANLSSLEKNAKELMDVLGKAGNVSAAVSLATTGGLSALLLGAVDVYTSDNMAPGTGSIANVLMNFIKRLQSESLVRLDGLLKWSLCKCVGGKTRLVRQKDIRDTDDINIGSMTDPVTYLSEFQTKFRKLEKDLINGMYDVIKNTERWQ